MILRVPAFLVDYKAMSSMDALLTRRELLKLAAAFAAAYVLPRIGTAAPAAADAGVGNAWAVDGTSNFQAVYGDPQLRAAFLLFLQNVFHLYPEDELHRLIEDVTRSGAS